MTDQPEWPARSWVNSDELASIARVTSRTILREIDRGHLTAERSGGRWIIERPEAERWLASYNPERTPKK